MMKVREAIEKLQQMDPEAEFVTRGSDHSYISVFRFEEEFAEECGELVEVYDDGTGPQASFGSTIIPVVVIAD
jgi:hypothetical protein